MTAEHGGFATAINCIDGRVQEPVAAWVKAHLNVRYVDTVTEPGADKALSEGPAEVAESIRRKVGISVSAHHSGAVAVVGHHDCAANPAPKEEHLRQIQAAVAVIAAWGLPVRVIGLWVDERWQVEAVCDSEGRGPA